MRKFVILCLAVYSAASYSSTLAGTSLRVLARVVKVAKVTPHPLVILGGFAAGYLIDQLADIIDESEQEEDISQQQTIAKSDIRPSLYEGEHTDTDSDVQTRAKAEETEQDEHNEELPTVVIVHGFISSDKFHMPLFSPLTKELMQRGFPIYLAKVSKIKFAVEQAELLHQEIEQFVPRDKEIILIGHSLGGVISRQYAHLHFKDRIIRNVVSIGTPHWGVDRDSRKSFIALSKTLEAAHKGLGSKIASTVLETTEYLSESYMEGTFNQEVVDVPGIDYLSAMTVMDGPIKKRAEFSSSKKILKNILDPFDREISDGLITVRNSMWSKMLYADKCVYRVSYSREIRGPLYDANHISQMSNFNAALSLKNNAYRLGRDIADYLIAHLNGGYINPPHCDPF